MSDLCLLGRIRFRAPTELLAAGGLIAWCDFDHGLVSLHGVELRRTKDGRVTISFPPARTYRGRLSCAAKPVSDTARRAIEREILGAAVREGWIR